MLVLQYGLLTPSKTLTELRRFENRAMLRNLVLCWSSKTRSLRATHFGRPIGTPRFTHPSEAYWISTPGSSSICVTAAPSELLWEDPTSLPLSMVLELSFETSSAYHLPQDMTDFLARQNHARAAAAAIRHGVRRASALACSERSRPSVMSTQTLGPRLYDLNLLP